MINKITRSAALLVVLVGCIVFAYFVWEKLNYKRNVPKYSLSIKGSYFIPADIVGFTSSNIPYIEMQIADKTIYTKLDSGFSGDIRIPTEVFYALENKKFLKTDTHYGIRGKRYGNTIYTVPQLRIGKMLFRSPRIFEMNRAFEEDGAFYEDGTSREPDYDLASIGWPTFCMVNLLLDFVHGKIAFCDSLNTLKEQGYPVEEFTVAPLLLDRGMLEFEATTEQGPLRCVLDTGSTPCCMNIKLPEGEEAIMDFNNIQEVTTFKIGGKDYGPITFIQLHTSCSFNAIIGMNFLQSKLVFIDFPNEKIYFSDL